MSGGGRFPAQAGHLWNLVRGGGGDPGSPGSRPTGLMDRCWGLLGKEHHLRERVGTRGSYPHGERHSASSGDHSRSALCGRKRRGGTYSVRSPVGRGIPSISLPLPDTCTARPQAACLPGPARALGMHLEPPEQRILGFSCHSGFQELTRTLGANVKVFTVYSSLLFLLIRGVSLAPVPCALQPLKVNPLFRTESQLSGACSPAGQGGR